jgi:glycerol-3-phosphate dehydrogenase (NAD(P)+)
MTRICVLGAGSWGTAFSLVLADAGNDVTLWARREEVCDTINRRRENTDYLPGVELPAEVTATHDTERALADAEVVVFAVPSQTFRANLEEWAPYVPGSAFLLASGLHAIAALIAVVVMVRATRTSGTASA